MNTDKVSSENRYKETLIFRQNIVNMACNIQLDENIVKNVYI